MQRFDQSKRYVFFEERTIVEQLDREIQAGAEFEILKDIFRDVICFPEKNIILNFVEVNPTATTLDSIVSLVQVCENYLYFLVEDFVNAMNVSFVFVHISQGFAPEFTIYLFTGRLSSCFRFEMYSRHVKCMKNRFEIKILICQKY